MKKVFVFFLIIVTINLYAVWDMKYMTDNQVGMAVSNFGIIGQDVRTTDSGAYWPINYPDETYIFGAGIWIGGIIDTIGGIDTLVTVGFNEDVIGHEFVPGITDAVMDDDTTIIHMLGFSRDVGAYESVCWFNDMDPTYHSVPENLPLDVSVRLNTYQPILPIVENAVFFEYTIVNNSDGPINDMYLGLNMDNDIGNERYANDLVGFIPKEDVVYQFQTSEEAGWEHFPGIIAAGIVQSPLSDREIILPYPDGSTDTIDIGEEIGLTSLKSFTIDVTPSNKVERYLVMAGYNFKTFDPSNPDASYEPWSSLPSVSDGVYEEDTLDEGDKRFILNCGPFDIAQGDSVKIVYVVYFQDYDTLRWEPVKNNMRINKMYWEHPDLLSIFSPSENAVIDTFLGINVNASFSAENMAVLLMNTIDDSRYTLYDSVYLPLLSLDVRDIPEGFYDVYVVSYSDTMYAYNKVFIKKDNPNENGIPYIILHTDIDSIIPDSLVLCWSGMDVEDSTNLNYKLDFIKDGTDTITLYEGTDTVYNFDVRSYDFTTGQFIIYAYDSEGGEGKYTTSSFSPTYVDYNVASSSSIEVVYKNDRIIINSEGRDIIVTDLLGRVVFSGKGDELEWDISKVGNGVYFIIDRKGGDVKKIEILK